MTFNDGRMIDVYWHPIPNSDYLTIALTNYDTGDFSFEIKWDNWRSSWFPWELHISTGYPNNQVVVIYLELGQFFCRYWYWGHISDEFNDDWIPWHELDISNETTEDKVWPLSSYIQWHGRQWFHYRCQWGNEYHRAKFYQDHLNWVKNAYRQ